jgi:hypothetical protein
MMKRGQKMTTGRKDLRPLSVDILKSRLPLLRNTLMKVKVQYRGVFPEVRNSHVWLPALL